MQTVERKIEISLSQKEKDLIDSLSKRCEMTAANLVRTLLFETGILCETSPAERHSTIR